jgi:hypothetical protein
MLLVVQYFDVRERLAGARAKAHFCRSSTRIVRRGNSGIVQERAQAYLNIFQECESNATLEAFVGHAHIHQPLFHYKVEHMPAEDVRGL